MRHAGTQTIETERLLLRPLTPEDAPMMYVNWANDPDVTRWLRWEPHKHVDKTRELLAAPVSSSCSYIGKSVMKQRSKRLLSISERRSATSVLI